MMGLMKKNKRKRIKYVDYDFVGVCELRELPSTYWGTYFKVVKKDGTLSKKIYVKTQHSYDRYFDKYECCSTDDVNKTRLFSPNTKISTDFEY